MADIEKQIGTTNLRQRFRDLDPLFTDANTAYAEYVSLAPATPLGHLRHTVTSTPVLLSDIPSWPTGVKKIDFFNLSEDTDIFFTDLAGQTPGAALGFPIPALAWLRYDNDVTPTVFKLATVSGSASLAIATYA